MNRTLAALVLAAVLMPGAASGDEGTAALAASCYGCHTPPGALRDLPAGTNGYRRLDNLSAPELAARLKLYKAGKLAGTLMNRIARGYSDAELDALAAHFGRAP